MSCSHLVKYKTDHGLENYDTIYSSFVINSMLPDPSYIQTSVSCFECENYNNDRLMACMYCIYFGCYENHFSHHASSKTHGMFVEISSGNIFCVMCQDFSYDADVDEIVQKYDKFNKGQYVSWKPTEVECKLLKEHNKRVKVDPTSSTGMKGMINLGNSCFMSCILQALLHTPMLRDYFFVDRHVCQAKSSTECLFCLFSRIYQRYYSDDDFTTLSLHDILCLVWKNDPNLYGSSQKDAHEFFTSARNSLHQISSQHNHPQGSCNCIIDSIFHGNFQSDVVCQNCSNVSTTIDPLWEISLDIPEPPSEGGLIECLYHYTRPEPLGSSGKIYCTSCNSYQESTKQLTFKLLPLIIVIQLKRFQHVVTKTKKKSLYVPFPIDLDMSPFLTGKRNEKDNMCNNPSSSFQSDDHGDNRYSLYAVIVHKGTLSGGHYVAYIRRTKNKWFKCNDLEVVPVEIEEVLASEGYLLFYHKTVLPYE